MENILKEKLDEVSLKKLEAIENPTVLEFISKYVSLCNPKSIFVSDGSPEDINFIRKKALEDGEEMPLKIKGHTVHFDSYYDQGRDKRNTKILLDEGEYLDPVIETGDRKLLTEEVHKILRNIMFGRTMYVLFYVLGPENSPFTIPAIQLTDSPYVAHSENILYRQGYNEFLRKGRSLTRFFKFVHSEGELDERKTSKNLDKRRVYIDLKDEIVYSCNTQYGGNTIGLKKLAMRLAIKRASLEGWLTEHMLLMGVNGPNGRVSYFAGAFPSMCGKTSTAMLKGERIVGDDISYIREINGVAKAVNVEKGMFGIIQGINSKDDPIQWKALHTPNEIIFSNVLVYDEGSVYWVAHDGSIPERGINHSGEWFRGKKDEKGNEIPPSHPNARFTLHLEILENVDENLHNPNGVEVSGIIYGGRDSDTWNPVCEAFDWEHGIVLKGASIESETTAATLGKVGVREFNPMSNLDFLSIPIGKYIEINLEFGKKLKKVPKIFGVNYFLKDENGRFLNDKNDKKVWLKWMEKRVHGEVRVLKTPVGFMPLYEDLKVLFKQYLGKDYTEDEYVKQFTLRVNENLSKIERLRKIYSDLKFVPARVFELYDEEEKRLKEAQSKFGNYIEPYKFEVV
ncbi:phosphoenolpyruvate carboxykinase (GTP) [Caldisericum exile]|uniref:Phosphoenolpyruvate carboxykinase [GTP] n=1 Tax=Caldisericum exile (strain DSM 21853 / NBRC 104410 / AZM16c01) TaxID=511051 RepID=A0A7U6GE94_CALEA|nr:phosphoenolpyruvate carboxykinase (GTP) [Caldisericum exile]BAL80798.1 phosphoenolpyruvate carboxykinase [GTP] [Caldisericum exile AZM16c01]